MNKTVTSKDDPRVLAPSTIELFNGSSDLKPKKVSRRKAAVKEQCRWEK